MPKIVDHDQRRRELVDASLRIIVRQGLAGATMRDIATEAGFANGVDQILLRLQIRPARGHLPVRLRGHEPSRRALDGTGCAASPHCGPSPTRCSRSPRR